LSEKRREIREDREGKGNGLREGMRVCERDEERHREKERERERDNRGRDRDRKRKKHGENEGQ
jgi:hypothetical protein